MQTPEVVTSAPESLGVLADLSLSDYRAHREGRAEAKPAAPAAPAAADDDEKPTAGGDAGDNVADEGAAEDTTEQDERKPAPAKKGGFVRKLEAKDREIETLRRQLAARSAGAPEANAPEGTPAAAPSAPAFEKPEPEIADFESIGAYTKALLAWDRARTKFESETAAAQERAQQEHKEVLDGWNTRQAEAQKKFSDYDEKLTAASDVMLSPAHQRLILESEHGAELAYQLASDKAELQKFAALAPLQAARYFGRLEAQHAPSADAPEPKEPRTSNAPKPIRPVGARASSSAVTPDIAKLPLADYRRLRESGKLR